MTRIEDYGLLVSAGANVKGIVPKLHASDLGTDKGMSKFKIGQKVTGRVLQVDPSARKLTLTLKPGLLGSRLQPLASLAQATVGVRAHGVVAGIKEFGIFVTFYGGVSGESYRLLISHFHTFFGSVCFISHSIFCSHFLNGSRREMFPFCSQLCFTLFFVPFTTSVSFRPSLTSLVIPSPQGSSMSRSWSWRKVPRPLMQGTRSVKCSR